MQYKLNGINTSTKAFARMIATIKPIFMAYFFETIYYSISKHLLAAGSKDGEFFGSISTYFCTMETNN